jgi:hypothetical protein
MNFIGLTTKLRLRVRAAGKYQTLGRYEVQFECRHRNRFLPQPRHGVFFDRRDQFFASAIQRFLLAGSRFASLTHSAARALHSNWLDIGTPCLRVDFILANLRQVPFSDYCPQSHCPNGQVTLTERSGADRADSKNDYPDNPEIVAAAFP